MQMYSLNSLFDLQISFLDSRALLTLLVAMLRLQINKCRFGVGGFLKLGWIAYKMGL